MAPRAAESARALRSEGCLQASSTLLRDLCDARSIGVSGGGRMMSDGGTLPDRSTRRAQTFVARQHPIALALVIARSFTVLHRRSQALPCRRQAAPTRLRPSRQGGRLPPPWSVVGHSWIAMHAPDASQQALAVPPPSLPPPPPVVLCLLPTPPPAHPGARRLQLRSVLCGARWWWARPGRASPPTAPACSSF